MRKDRLSGANQTTNGSNSLQFKFLSDPVNSTYNDDRTFLTNLYDDLSYYRIAQPPHYINHFEEVKYDDDMFFSNANYYNGDMNNSLFIDKEIL